MVSFVALKDVKKIYHMGEVEIMAAAGIDFEIKRGEFAVVVGPSGAGKTTVLNILGGMDTATEGEVLVDGKNIAAYSQRQLTAYRRDDIGFVFQFYNLIPNLTALENVELALQICKNPMDAKKVLEEVGLLERSNNFPAQLSGGDFVHKPHLHGVPVDFAVLPLGDGEYGIPQAEGGDDQGRTAADADYRHPEPFLVAEQITQSDLQMKGQPFPDKADAFQQYPLADGGCFGAHELGGYGSQRGEAGPQGGQGNGRNRRQGSGN